MLAEPSSISVASALARAPISGTGSDSETSQGLEKVFRLGMTIRSSPPPTPELPPSVEPALTVQNLTYMAMDYYQKGNWQGYVGVCSQLYVLRPRDLDVLRGLIKGCMELQQHRHVIVYTTKLLSINDVDEKSCVSALKKRCQAYWNDDQTDNALQDMVTLLLINAFDSEVWLWGCLATNPHLMAPLSSLKDADLSQEESNQEVHSDPALENSAELRALLEKQAEVTMSVSDLKILCQAHWHNQQCQEAIHDMIVLLQKDRRDSQVWRWGCRATNPQLARHVKALEVTESEETQSTLRSNEQNTIQSA